MRNDALISFFALIIILLSFASCQDDDEGVLFPNGSRELTLNFDYAFSTKKYFCFVSTSEGRIYYDTVFTKNVLSRVIEVPDLEGIHVTIGSETEEGFVINTFTGVGEILTIIPSRFLACDNLLYEQSNKIEKKIIVIKNVSQAQFIQSIFKTTQPEFEELNSEITFEGFVRKQETNGQVHSHLMAVQEEGSNEVRGLVFDITQGVDTIFLDFDLFDVLDKHVFNMEQEGHFSMKCVGANKFGTVDLGSTSFYPPTNSIEYYLPKNIDVDIFELFLRGTIDENATLGQSNITILDSYESLPDIVDFDFGKINNDGSTNEKIQYKNEQPFDYLSANYEYFMVNNIIPIWRVHFTDENVKSFAIPEIPELILSEFPRIKSKYKNPRIISFEASEYLNNMPNQFQNSTLERRSINCHYRLEKNQRYGLN